MLRFLSFWTSGPSSNSPKLSMHRICCVWKSPRLVLLVLIKSVALRKLQWWLILSYIWPLNLVITPTKLLLCHLYYIRDVQNWMLMDRLKLNPDKTEFLILGTRQQLEKVITSHLVVGESRISPSTKVKNLGSWFYSSLDMLSHVNNICSSSFYYIYNRRRIRKYLFHQTAISLIHAFITSKLDYYNSLLYGLSTVHINKLQRVQNAVARLVTTTSRICHITPILKDLHWLPIKYRTEFKIVLLTFKCLHGLAP